MLCSSCGFKVPNNARYCKNCGADVSAARKGTLQGKALTDLISHSLQPTAQPTPKRSGHSNHPPQPARHVNPGPEPAQRSNQREPGQSQASGEHEEPLPAVRKKYRSSASAASTADDLTLADGEVAIRTYFCSEWTAPWYRFPKDDFKGYLTVTNRRIVYRSVGENVRSVREIPVESYRGFECSYGHVWNASEVLAGTIALLAGTGLLLLAPLAASLAFFAAGLALILMARRRAMIMRIYSERHSASPVSLVSLSNAAHLKDNDVFDAGVPAEQTAAMMSEFGALLSDVVEMGDEAAAKWTG